MNQPGREDLNPYLRVRSPLLYPLSYAPVVGVKGFEPPISSSQSWRHTGLAYTPVGGGDCARPATVGPRTSLNVLFGALTQSG